MDSNVSQKNEELKKEEVEEKKVNKKNNFNFIMDQNVTYLLNLDKTKDIEAIGHFTNEYLKMGGTIYVLITI